MHYIRFLRSPKVAYEKSWATVSTLVTITTDLGDEFLAAELPIHALLIEDGDESTITKKSVIARTECVWQSSSRVLQLSMTRLPTAILKGHVRLLVSTSPEYTRPSQVQPATLNYLPSVLHAWSSPFDLTHNGTTGYVERRLSVSDTVTLRVCEEMGESIARHVWDAGIVLSAFIRDIHLQPGLRGDDSPFARKLRMLAGPSVIELGSGCGIVGLQLAHTCEQARILLTDLPEAMEVLERNISVATLATGSQVSKAVLDWEEGVPEAIAQQVFDLVLVSDCTYNSDSIPSLVRTLGLLVEKSPKALVVVAMKVRHESEAVFHELIEKAGLHQCSHHSFEVPDTQREANGQELENVDIYVYQAS